MTLEAQARVMLPAVEKELKKQVGRLRETSLRPFRDMLSYHMGWSGASGPRAKAGKRIRPLLTLLACASVSGRWRAAVPAAAALELVHNFSLVHDDIQDNSPTRRGRTTVWKLHGVPLAIDVGDALFAIANLATLNLMSSYEPAVVATAAGIIEQACLDLTKGQFLDLYHQEKGRLTVDGYWQMIDGKTAALLAAGAHLGALLGGASAKKCYQYRKFGQLLGRAFQVEDDILGIWGEEHRTGKSAATDLAEGKLSLPVVHGLARSPAFRVAWRDAQLRSRRPARLRQMLDEVGAREFATGHAARLTRNAVATLKALRPKGEAGAALEELAMKLLKRNA